MDRLPGGWITLWVAVIAIVRLVPDTVISRGAKASIAVTYLAYCIYTWVAEPLARLWVRLFPPR